MLISTKYIEKNREKHDNSTEYGISGQRYVQLVMVLAQKYDTVDVLDYGCGKGTLGRNLPFQIQEYDPAILKHSQPPEPADLVVCTDVMEHVEPQCVSAVLDDIKRLTKKCAVFTIGLAESQKHFSDGENLHICLKPYDWWLKELMERFTLMSFEHQPGQGIMAVVEP